MVSVAAKVLQKRRPPTQKPKGVEMRPFFLECCSRKVKAYKVINLEPTSRYVDRFLMYGFCKNPKCGRAIYRLEEFDLIGNRVVINRNKPKRLKHIGEWVERLEKQESYSPLTAKIKYGNKSAMAFIFGKSKETPLGVLHRGFDFNGTVRREFLIAK